ncbi:hypothetical protein JOB18_025924 [Solea senegalensis]|uniref:Uncharacterized protein n=1 Tax=Solea senegalensis TaxID=28829 RepID=A0AAV6Q0K5_SOLSE|nr:hypothetical protein JOB18_025924 [Solea senegalensis]
MRAHSTVSPYFSFLSTATTVPACKPCNPTLSHDVQLCPHPCYHIRQFTDSGAQDVVERLALLQVCAGKNTQTGSSTDRKTQTSNRQFEAAEKMTRCLRVQGRHAKRSPEAGFMDRKEEEEETGRRVVQQKQRADNMNDETREVSGDTRSTKRREE